MEGRWCRCLHPTSPLYTEQRACCAGAGLCLDVAAAQAAATPPEPESAHTERAEGLITATSQAEEELAELVQQDRCVAGLSLALQAFPWHCIGAGILRVTLNTCVT